MKVLLYASKTTGIGKRLQEVVETSIKGMDIQVFRSIDNLAGMLRRPLSVSAEDVAVLLATSKAELLDILSIRDLTTDVRIIMIIPDMEKDTISKGHLLRPRFLTYADGNFAEVVAVLAKMIANHYQLKADQHITVSQHLN